jgi:hypothetical protein
MPTPEMKDEPKYQLPEAPASVTYSIMTKNGFPVLFTVRAESGLELLEKMLVIEKKLLESGATPQQQRHFEKKEKVVEYVEGRVCPVDGARLVKKTTKDGKVIVECENRKFDFATKQTTGCSFIEWPK